jgi:hypothetical protein
MAQVEAQVEALAAMKPTELKQEWRRAHEAEPPRVAASLLARSLTYDLQCAARGGAGARMRQRLMDGGSGSSRSAPALKLAAGTQLVREWGGSSHHVLMEEKGHCSYRGKSFTSLSAVARHITGAHWSGPRFFGARP